MERASTKRVEKWVKRVGERQAAIHLIAQGVAISTVQKLVSGSYPSQPRGMLEQAIENAIAASDDGSGAGEAS